MKQSCTLMLSLLFAMISLAQPKATDIRILNGFRIYRDLKDANVLYYEPFGYRLATDKNGRPALTLLQMRHAGTAATRNSGNIQFRNILQFKVVAHEGESDKLPALRSALIELAPNAVLKPLPIAKFESLLVFAPADNADSSLKLLTNGFSENGGESYAPNASYWTERNFSIRLSDADAQLIAAALRNKSTAISMSYAFYTSFSNEGLSSFSATVNGRVNPSVMQHFENARLNDKDTTSRTVLIKADAVAINADTDRWPDVVKQIDINEKLPPSYPALDVYCYDFNNVIRTDIHSKKVEIRATSINGSNIVTSVSFTETQPDVYAKSLRFVYAIRFDKPFFYRVTYYTKDGEMKAGQWTERRGWNEMLDITSTENDQ